MITKNIASSVLQGRAIPLGDLLRDGSDNSPDVGGLETELSRLRMENTNLRVELEHVQWRAMIRDSTRVLMVPARKFNHERDIACAMRAANRKLQTELNRTRSDLKKVRLKLDISDSDLRVIRQRVSDLETDLRGDENDHHRISRLLRKRIARVVECITVGELEQALDLLDGVLGILDRAGNGSNQEENRRNDK